MDTKPMGRVKHAWTKGGAVSWIAMVALLLATILVGVCMYTALYGSIFDMPIMTAMATIADSPLEEMKETFREGKATEREARAALKEVNSEDLSKSKKKLVETAEDFLDQFEDFTDTPSVMTMRSMVKTITEDRELLELLELADSEEAAQRTQQEAKDILQVLDVIVIVILICFGLCMLLTFLAAMFRGIVPAVFGLLGALLLIPLFGGGIMTLAALVLYVVGIVLTSVLRGSYNKYWNSATAFPV